MNDFQDVHPGQKFLFAKQQFPMFSHLASIYEKNSILFCILS